MEQVSTTISNNGKIAQIPSVGRIVHYKDDRDVINAAIITKVWSNSVVDLFLLESRPSDNIDCVVNIDSRSSTSFGEGLNQWNWPEKI